MVVIELVYGDYNIDTLFLVVPLRIEWTTIACDLVTYR